MHNSNEVKKLMNFKKMIAGNKACTCLTMTAVGALMGFAASTLLYKHCCCCATIAGKAKKAFKAVEDKLMP